MCRSPLECESAHAKRSCSNAQMLHFVRLHNPFKLITTLEVLTFGICLKFASGLCSDFEWLTSMGSSHLWTCVRQGNIARREQYRHEWLWASIF